MTLESTMYRRTINAECREDKGFIIEYVLVSTLAPENGYSGESYGIRLVKSFPLAEKREANICHDITACRKRAEELLLKLYEFEVTPVALWDVLYELIG